jgi:hypothetical protein
MAENQRTTQSAQSSGGAASNVSGRANVTHTVNVEAPKDSKLSGLIAPIIAAVAGAVSSAYATHQLALVRAPERTASQTETALGTARSAMELALSTKADPLLIAKLQELASQTQAIQANVELLDTPLGGASLQADFWMPVNKGSVLGGAASFGIYSSSSSSINVTLNDSSRQLSAGSRLPYKTKAGASCFVVYVGPSPDGKLFGFKTTCGV